jgi:hypothetical protein
LACLMKSAAGGNTLVSLSTDSIELIASSNYHLLAREILKGIIAKSCSSLPLLMHRASIINRPSDDACDILPTPNVDLIPRHFHPRHDRDCPGRFY